MAVRKEAAAGVAAPELCRTHGISADLELRYDFLWRVHNVIPPRGMIGVFNRSLYEDVLVVRVRNLAPKAVWQNGTTKSTGSSPC